jgi:hypothetical protein
MEIGQRWRKIGQNVFLTLKGGHQNVIVSGSGPATEMTTHLPSVNTIINFLTLLILFSCKISK